MTMPINLSLTRERTLPNNMQNFVAASEREGFKFVARMRDEWNSGKNCFDKHSECFMVASLPIGVVGIGGVNQDPYVSNQKAIGRLRHVYVLPEFRRVCIGTALVKSLISSAESNFDLLRLQVADNAGRLFYESMGFVPIVDSSASHALNFK